MLQDYPTQLSFAFMYFKSWLGLLPSFQPYQSFQHTLSYWVGANVPAIAPWLLSLLNGITILGFLFARIRQLLHLAASAYERPMKGLMIALQHYHKAGERRCDLTQWWGTPRRPCCGLP